MARARGRCNDDGLDCLIPFTTDRLFAIAVTEAVRRSNGASRPLPTTPHYSNVVRNPLSV